MQRAALQRLAKSKNGTSLGIFVSVIVAQTLSRLWTWLQPDMQNPHTYGVYIFTGRPARSAAMSVLLLPSSPKICFSLRRGDTLPR